MPPDPLKVHALRALGRVPLPPGPPPSSEWPAPTNLFEKAAYTGLKLNSRWLLQKQTGPNSIYKYKKLLLLIIKWKYRFSLMHTNKKKLHNLPGSILSTFWIFRPSSHQPCQAFSQK